MGFPFSSLLNFVDIIGVGQFRYGLVPFTSCVHGMLPFFLLGVFLTCLVLHLIE